MKAEPSGPALITSKVVSSRWRVKEEEWDGWSKLGCVLGELIALPKGAVRHAGQV